MTEFPKRKASAIWLNAENHDLLLVAQAEISQQLGVQLTLAQTLEYILKNRLSRG